MAEEAAARKDERAAGLCNSLGYHLDTLGDYEGARPYVERALAIFTERLGPDHSYTRTVEGNLAAVIEKIKEASS